MLKSILFKEYVKTKKILLLFTILFCFSLFQIFLDSKNMFEYNEATNVLLNIAQFERFNFNNLGLFSFAFALALGVFQFYPEVNQGRIRLYLHLPIKHFKLITIILFSGIALLLIYFILVSLVFMFIINSYYPYELFLALYSKLLPIFLCAVLIYLAVCLGFLEPSIKRKTIYLGLVAFWVYTLSELSQSSYFVSLHINIFLLAFIIAYIIVAYEVFSAYTKGYIK